MRAYKCDRCGEIREVTWKTPPGDRPYPFGHKKHLCPACARNLLIWFYSGSEDAAKIQKLREERRKENENA